MAKFKLKILNKEDISKNKKHAKLWDKAYKTLKEAKQHQWYLEERLGIRTEIIQLSSLPAIRKQQERCNDGV